jgi:peptidoglycan/LPS O-acetylase OafA/YrhL
MIAGAATRIKFLDGWRGLAIFTVLIGHFSPLDPELGSFGVELFFVLSGRLMAQILFEKKMALPIFFQRRFARVYPALVVLVIGLTLLSAVAAILGKDRGIDVLSAVAALTFTFNYLPALGYPTSRTLEHIWSLAVEEHCYALLALLAIFRRRRSDPRNLLAHRCSLGSRLSVRSDLSFETHEGQHYRRAAQPSALSNPPTLAEVHSADDPSGLLGQRNRPCTPRSACWPVSPVDRWLGIDLVLPLFVAAALL